MLNLDPIKLSCRRCGNTGSYDRCIDNTIPETVVRIETTLCDRCDDGDFMQEIWIDECGKEVLPQSLEPAT